jgi:Trypsin-like peptidase domain
MSGLDTRRLVLVESTLSASDGKESFVYGTGYFVTDSLVLTAHHVLSKGVPKSVRVRIEEGKPQWREAMKEPAWQDESLDAALLCVNGSLKNIDPPTLDGLLLGEDRPWNSTAYPKSPNLNRISCFTLSLIVL